MKTAILKNLLICTTVTYFSSCVAITPHLVRRDADGLRREINQYYKEEILRNVIKESNQEPYVHVDVTQLNSTIMTTLNSTEGGSRSAVSLTGAVTRLFSWAVTPGISNSVNINSAPVINDPSIIKSYRAYANLKPKGSVKPVERGLKKPLPGTYLKDGLLCPSKDFLSYGSEDEYFYWIPTEFKTEFFNLNMDILARKDSKVTSSPPKAPTTVYRIN